MLHGCQWNGVSLNIHLPTLNTHGLSKTNIHNNKKNTLKVMLFFYIIGCNQASSVLEGLLVNCLKQVLRYSLLLSLTITVYFSVFFNFFLYFVYFSDCETKHMNWLADISGYA